MTAHPGAFEKVTGAILVGGKSRRLGRDKVLLPYEGRPLALHVYELLSDLFPRTLLIGHPRPELESHGLTCVPDKVQGKGVLGGIFTALASSPTPHVFITGADMPFITPSLITMILSLRHDADAVVPRGPKGLEPLCAVYSKACFESISHSLETGTLRIMTAISDLRVLTPEVRPADGEPDPFLNINYPEDLEILKKKI